MRHLFCLLLICLGSCQFSEPNEYTKHQDNADDKMVPYYDQYLEKAFPQESMHIEAWAKAREVAMQQIKSDISRKPPGMNDEWTVQGPGNLGGRITTIALHPDNADIIYVGFSSGGAFKTENGGADWFPIFDDNAFLSVGHIAIDPNDPERVYLGTGDPVISGTPHIGNGLFLSEDGGATWTSLGLRDQRIIAKIEMDPTNSDKMFVASMGLPFVTDGGRGLFRTEDGGSSWERVLYPDDTTGILNVIINPERPNLVYASTWERMRSNTVNDITGDNSGVFLSEDGGTTWHRNIAGLPSGIQCKAGIEVCQNHPNNVYAVYIDEDRELEGIYRSQDYGLSYEPITGDLPGDIMRAFGWYFGKVHVNPDDPEHLFLNSVNLFETRDGGSTWVRADDNQSEVNVHADKHDIKFDAEGNVYLGTDGGLYKRGPNDTEWEDIEDIPANLIYRVAYNPHEPELYYGGLQDNGTTAGNEAAQAEWGRLWGGDGFQAVFNPNREDHFFYETQNGRISGFFDGEFIGDVSASIDIGRRHWDCLLYTSPSPRDQRGSRMPSSA